MNNTIAFLALALLPLSVLNEKGRADDLQSRARQFTLECEDIIESSGIAASWRDANVLWTHNDSGDSPRLFAFDRKGRHRQEVRIVGAEHTDWEDIASYAIDHQPRLLIGDVGDNRMQRRDVVCYGLSEPMLGDQKAIVDQVWRIRYPDGPCDCEAIAVDVDEKMILLVCKTKSLQATIYSVPLAIQNRKISVTAKREGVVSVPLVTAMDIHPRDGRIILATYVDALVFGRKRVSAGGTDWKKTFEQTPKLVKTPARRQGESICFDRSTDAIWLTSEKKPTPLLFVPLSGKP